MPKRSGTDKKHSHTTSHSETRTMQELLAVGEDAARLLKSDVYNIAHELVMQDVIERWMSEESPEARDAIWHQAQALGQVAVKLRAMVQQAEEIANNEAQRLDPNSSHYVDEQGFVNSTSDPYANH